MSKKNFVVYPSINDSNVLSDYYYRLIWYLNPFIEMIGEATFLSEIALDKLGPPPSYLDQAIIDYEYNFRDLIKVVNPNNSNIISNKLKNADCILSLLPRDLVLRELENKYAFSPSKVIAIYYIDHSKSQYAGSFWLKIAQEVFHADKEYLPLSLFNFSLMKKEIPSKPIYLFGTGPSLKNVMDMDISDGMSFACNTMVKNKSLMNKINPPLIIVGDPIFHAGCSTFAAEFRKELCDCLQKYKSWLIVPMRDYHIYLKNLPECFNSRIIAIPFKHGSTINYNFDEEFNVTTTSNILTLYLLPLAAYFSDIIYIGGCDGRPKEDNNYFWKHDTSSQFNDKMKDIKEAHPAFFDISYDDYYNIHCETLDKWIYSLEHNGKEIVSITPSFIPALSKRYQPIHLKENPLISIIMPVYNAEPYISEAIESIQTQDVQSWELLIIDDGSTDSSMKTAYSFAKNDTRILIQKNLKKGVSSARNYGLDLARGKYICFLDADDYFDGNTFSGQRIILNNDSNKKVSFVVTEIVDEYGNSLDWYLGRKELISFDDFHGCPVHIGSIMVESAVIGDLRFDEKLTNGEDWLFLAELAARVATFHKSNIGSLKYRRHSSSTVINDYYEHEIKLSKVIERIYEIRDDKYLKNQEIRLDIWPQKKDLIYKRLMNTFIWGILDKNEEYLQALVENDYFLKTINLKSNKLDLKSRFVNNTILYFACHRNRVPKIIVEKDILNYLKLLNFHKKFKILYQAVEEINSNAKPMHEMTPLIGPYKRKTNANISETKLIADLFTSVLVGSSMVDVGAHHGSAFMPFLKKGWYIFAFEPDKKNFNKLQNKLANIDCYNRVSLDRRAVSNENKQGVPFYSSEVSTGISSLSAFHESHQEGEKVDSVTLNEALSNKSITSVDFLKVDTEGHDLFVLQGFPWERFQPAVIECEFEDAKTVPLGYSWKDMADYLTEKQYTVYVSEWHPIIKYGIRHDWCQLIRYPCELKDKGSWGNLIAFRDPINEDRLIDILKKQIELKNEFTRTVENNKALQTSLNLEIVNYNSIIDRSKSIILLGNGPSLTECNFLALNKHSTIGMNAAFRHWHKNKVYPNYYICLDTVVTESLSAEILDLVSNRHVNNIKYFFLRKNILKFKPDLDQIPEVLFFEDYYKSPYFEGITNKLTTGSFAALFGAMLGYKRLYLLGIDLNYVQQIPEAENIEGNILEMKETPTNNPNYFFNEYQRKGDRYNIPDSTPNLHYKSWVAVKERLDKFAIDVINCNPKSKLDIFDFGELPCSGGKNEEINK